MNSLDTWMYLFIVVLMCCYCNGYPGGPPHRVCSTGLPIHMKDGKVIESQKLPSPYVIEVNTTTFAPGDTIDVKIKSYVGQAFRGLFVQVVALPNGVNDSIEYSPVGLYERNKRNIKLMTCRYMLDTLGHMDRFMKFEASFKWRSPLIIKHNVVVRATILKEFDIYWHNVESATIELKQTGVSQAEELEKPWLNEIIKTVKATGDPETQRNLTRERFNKGYKNAITREGLIMVHYVTNVLPFKDSPVPGYTATAHKPRKGSETVNSTTKTTGNGTDKAEVATPVNKLNDSNVKNSPDMTEPMVVGEVLNKGKESLNTSTRQKFYKVLVEALLNDDIEVANTLHEIISENVP